MKAAAALVASALAVAATPAAACSLAQPRASEGSVVAVGVITDTEAAPATPEGEGSTQTFSSRFTVESVRFGALDAAGAVDVAYTEWEQPRAQCGNGPPPVDGSRYLVLLSKPDPQGRRRVEYFTERLDSSAIAYPR
ncbi:hypothetical protein [Caulobacter sp. 17J80-11]|uniref:hypothetical protein n=1 Tax=Caulobacter sp. 17J80-11 TaxID=2763502 RepID=UPI0016539413|nr:hypothetical protein [Caulobacter sp. 17J80-11]MBC6981973.1 hypothetical protein [Caulobacter sp. 17J80-11]